MARLRSALSELPYAHAGKRARSVLLVAVLGTALLGFAALAAGPRGDALLFLLVVPLALAAMTRGLRAAFVHVLAGKIELVVDDESVVLSVGDSAYYRADVPHSFRNVGRGKAQFFGVTTPPNL